MGVGFSDKDSKVAIKYLGFPNLCVKQVWANEKELDECLFSSFHGIYCKMISQKFSLNQRSFDAIKISQVFVGE